MDHAYASANFSWGGEIWPETYANSGPTIASVALLGALGVVDRSFIKTQYCWDTVRSPEYFHTGVSEDWKSLGDRDP